MIPACQTAHAKLLLRDYHCLCQTFVAHISQRIGFDRRLHTRQGLAGYNKDLYRFEFKTAGERSKALKLLKLRGLDAKITA